MAASIADVAASTGMTIAMIRACERAGVLGPPAGSTRIRDDYSPDDVGWLITAHQLNTLRFTLDDTVVFINTVRTLRAAPVGAAHDAAATRHAGAVAALQAVREQLTDRIAVIDDLTALAPATAQHSGSIIGGHRAAGQL